MSATDEEPIHIPYDQRFPSSRLRLPQYRESVLEISAVLQQMQPTVRAMHFIGQSTGRSTRGFSQKEQLKVSGRHAGPG